MNRDGLLIDLNRVRSEMRGISPKVSTYLKLKTREKELIAQLGMDVLVEENNRRSAGLDKLRHLRCPVRGCPNLRKETGQLDKLGFVKRGKMCVPHMNEYIQKKAIENRNNQLHGKARS